MEPLRSNDGSEVLTRYQNWLGQQSIQNYPVIKPARRINSNVSSHEHDVYYDTDDYDTDDYDTEDYEENNHNYDDNETQDCDEGDESSVHDSDSEEGTSGDHNVKNDQRNGYGKGKETYEQNPIDFLTRAETSVPAKTIGNDLSESAKEPKVGTQSTNNVAYQYYLDPTISDDHSAGSKINQRNLQVLKEDTEFVKSVPQTPTINLYRGDKQLKPDSGPPANGNHALQDYQMQLMLLEQQNKKRKLMAKQEQDTIAATQLNNDTVANMSQMQQSKNTPSHHVVEADLQGILSGTDTSTLNLQKLQEYITMLQVKVQQLELTPTRIPSRFQILYRILSKGKKHEDHISRSFLDHPEWQDDDRRRVKCSNPIANFDLYLEKNKDISFLVYRGFLQDSPYLRNDQDPDFAHAPRTTIECIRPVNTDLIAAIDRILSDEKMYSEFLSKFRDTGELVAPYLFIYHSRKHLESLKQTLSSSTAMQLSLLTDYVMERYGPQYTEADSLFERGKVTPTTIPYLFKLGGILVSHESGEHVAHVASSSPEETEFCTVLRASRQRNDMMARTSTITSLNSALPKPHKEEWVIVHNISAWNWGFDGNFQRQTETLQLNFVVELDCKALDSMSEKSSNDKGYLRKLASHAEKNIADLNLFPVDFAPREVVDKLRRRGQTFWKCRDRNLVSYREIGTDSIEASAEERHMIDLKTYKSLHANSFHSTPLRDEIGPELLARAEPPDDHFELLLPLTIKGYNLRRKKWFDLAVDRISDVKWNKESFKKLVIDRKARDLVEALITKKVAAEKSTDLIAGKGNGLILLLHGGPGTGKTLTAESVAEIAEKPLYRVSCGDVGTQADKVETYLESVLHLGKIWGCVVLLDEADVFLEQRSLEDLARNALVSVFLRVLEYYEGILVLTSNRVGTFDEAFKSRIQLALHYPTLGEYQRLRIWEMFIERLESFKDDMIDTDSLRDHLSELKEAEMNGREIRNAITIARQYSDWKGQRMTFEHLKDVIEISSRFDKYLNKLNHGLTPNQLAEDEGIRLS